ncbi:MAG: hypothetical protein JRH16_13795 [Deltaproteobacteria bacterium]|nr:hypothetical protein [Deltaproteobacteria bacterium]MBW2359806.1 hypothetical protein [Deltaproteobacteria bacterium]
MSFPISLRPRSLAPLSALALAWACMASASAQAGPLGELDRQDRAVVEALSLTDEALRRAALEAVGEADVLGALVRQQERSSATFRRLLEPYDRQVQADVFELARYPELVAEIVEAGPKSQQELEAIAFRYPDAVSDAAARTGHDYWKVIARTDALLRDETAGFEATLADLPERKRDAFHSLVAAPDLLALLAENAGVAVWLGDAYEREPDDVLAWLEGVEREVSGRGGDEVRQLARAVEDAEEPADEIAASTQAVREVAGHSSTLSSPTHHAQVNVRVSPFPFWVGHPWWYSSTYASTDPWYFWYPHSAWSFGGVHFGSRLHVSLGSGWPHGASWGWNFPTPSQHSHTPRLTHHEGQHGDQRRRRHARADWERHPHVAASSRNLERSRRAEPRERGKSKERRGARRDADAAEHDRDRRGHRGAERAEADRRGRNARDERRVERRREARAKSRSRERRVERDEARRRKLRAERRREEKRAERPRAERASRRIESSTPKRSRREVRRVSRPLRERGGRHQGRRGRKRG